MEKIKDSIFRFEDCVEEIEEIDSLALILWDSLSHKTFEGATYINVAAILVDKLGSLNTKMEEIMKTAYEGLKEEIQ